jgi:hypothetical protein
MAIDRLNSKKEAADRRIARPPVLAQIELIRLFYLLGVGVGS